MKAKNLFETCVLCTNNSVDSLEHIIPDCIGGRLEVGLLCTHCNNQMGTELVSKLKKDPSIRLAIWNLKNEIPDIYEKIECGQDYIGKDSNNNQIKFVYKNSSFKVKTQKKDDGSIISDTQRVQSDFRKMLKKDGLSDKEIDERIKFFENQEDESFVQLSKNLKAIKRSVKNLFPSLLGPLIENKMIVLIAYEYLSLLLGDLIYDSYLDYIRAFIRNSIESKDIFVEPLSARHYLPYHKIYPELLDEETIINIRLFEWLVYKVHFKNIRVRCKDYVYVEDLKNKKSYIAESLEEAKKNIYYYCN